MHRLDQPCSGVILFAKSSQVAHKISESWKARHVQKEYLCIVNQSNDNFLSQSPRKEKIKLVGVLREKKRRTTAGHSVMVTPFHAQDEHIYRNSKKARICELEYRILSKVRHKKRNNSQFLIHVTTNSGARHQVRAMLAHLLQCPVVGDVRYGNLDLNGSRREARALSDKSVALHARKLILPPFKETTGVTDSVKVHNLSFTAPVPKSWKLLFGLTEEFILEVEQ